MNCPIKTHENTDWLLEYAAGRLDRERAAEVARHVEVCRECARLVEEQRVVWNTLERWEPETVSADFDRRLYRRIDEAKAGGWMARVFGPLKTLWRPMVPVAAACLLIAAGVILHTPQALVSPADSEARVEKIEPEQVERTLDDMQMLRELAVKPNPESQRSKSM